MLFLTICRNVPKTSKQNSLIFLNGKGGQWLWRHNQQFRYFREIIKWQRHLHIPQKRQRHLQLLVQRHRSLPGPGIANCSLSPDRNIGNNVLRYFLKTNVTSSSLSMHVNFTTRTVAERPLSLLTMINKAFCSQDIPTDWIWWTIYFMILSSVFSVCLIL